MRRASLLNSFSYAFQGVAYCFKTQPNMRVHLMAAVCALILGFWLSLTAYEMAVLLVTIGMVFVAEMINTAIEKAVDLVCPQYHPVAKAAKDAAAGAVLAASLIAVAVGYLLLFIKLVERMH